MKKKFRVKHSDESFFDEFERKQQRRAKRQKKKNDKRKNNFSNQYDYELYLDNEAEDYHRYD